MRLSLVLVLLVFGFTVEGFALSLRGAEPRKKATTFSRDAVPIDELVRMEDDPEFDQWKREEARMEAERNAGIEEFKQEREAEVKAQEAARLEYLKEREVQRRLEIKKQSEQWHGYIEHKNEKRRLAIEHEKSRREFVQIQTKQTQAFETARLERLRKVYGADRLPASVENEPKYPHLREKKSQ